MQDDPFPAAERILSDIESIFQKDPELKEFDILPVTLNQNKSPVHHVENCLGLEQWCVRHVYCYAYHRLFDMRQQKNRRADPELQSRLLMGALLLNPDVQTFWNMRRELLQAGRLDNQSELHFTSVVLSRKPKCSEAFSYRKWIVSKLKTNGEKLSLLLARELNVARAAANRYANNYHAWQHCIWSLVHLAPADTHLDAFLEEWGTSQVWVTMHVSDHSGWQYRQFLLKQLCGPLADRIPSATVSFVNDKTLHQYVQPVLEDMPLSVCLQNVMECKDKEQLVQCGGAKEFVMILDECINVNELNSLSILLAEMELNTDLITRYTGHEALWCHRRFLLTSLKSILDHNKYGVENSDADTKSDASCGDAKKCDLLFQKNNFEACQEVHDMCDGSEKDRGNLCIDTYNGASELWRALFKAFLWHEEQLVNGSDGGDANQKRLAIQHGKWLQQILQLDVTRRDSPH